MPKYTQSLDFIKLIPWPFLDHLILTPAPWPCVNCLCRPESRKVWAPEWMPWKQIMASREEREASRREILGVLARKGFQVAESTNFYHGRLKYFLPHLKPRIISASKAAPRGPGGPSWVTASELQVNKRSSITQTSKFFFCFRYMYFVDKVSLIWSFTAQQSKSAKNYVLPNFTFLTILPRSQPVQETFIGCFTN